MPAKIEIVPMKEQYIEGFRDCLDSVARERKYIGFVAAPSLEETRQFVRQSMARDDISLLALDGERVVGWIDIMTSENEGFSHKGRLGMGLMQDYRGQGLGTRLMEVALAAAREKGLERVELDVFASNKAAIGLYEKLSFEVEGVKRKARKLDGAYDDIICMALLLGGESSI